MHQNDPHQAKLFESKDNEDDSEKERHAGDASVHSFRASNGVLTNFFLFNARNAWQVQSYTKV